MSRRHQTNIHTTLQKKTTAIENDRTTAVERITSERHEPQPSTAQTVSALDVSNVT